VKITDHTSEDLFITILPVLQEKMGEGERVVGEEGVYTGDPPPLPHHNLNKIQNRFKKFM